MDSDGGGRAPSYWFVDSDLTYLRPLSISKKAAQTYFISIPFLFHEP